MARFKPGQKITLRLNRPYHTWQGNPIHAWPRFGEIYTVLQTIKFDPFDCVVLREINNDNAFDERDFEPVVSDSVLEKELTSILGSIEEPVTQ